MRPIVLHACAIIAALLSASSVQGQTVSVTGHVIDAATQEPVSAVTVHVRETGERTRTDSAGIFHVALRSTGRYTVSLHHVAFAGVERTIVPSSLPGDTLVVAMQPAIIRGDEVVVQSTRIATEGDNTPYVIDVALSDRLIRQAYVTVADALSEIPGVALVRDGTWETTVSIRGMSRSNIVTMVDNTRIETANDIAGGLSLFNLHDLERVELVKSSGSVLYGSGALGGVVHLITKRASFTEQQRTNAEIAGDVSSVDRGAGEYLALENSSDRYAVRMSGGYRSGGDTRTPEGLLPHSQFHDFSIVGSFALKTAGEQSLVASYQRSQAEDTGIPGGSPIAAAAAARYTLARRELFALDYAIPNLSSLISLVTLRASRQEIDRNVEIIQSPTVTVTPHAINTTTNVQGECLFSPSATFLLTAGAEAWERLLDSRRERFLAAKGQIIGDRPAPSSRYFSGGAYVQDEWQVVPDRLTLTSGARYDRIHVSNDETWNPEYVIAGGVRQTAPAGQQILWEGMSVANESWSADAGTRLAIVPSLHATFLVSTAFRSPSLEERYQFLDLGSVVVIGDPHLQPERSVALNAGLHWEGEALRMHADAFLNHLTDLVTTMPGVFEGRAANVNTNIGKARLYGYEFAGELRMSSWSVMKASLAYVRGEDTYHGSNLPQIAPLTGDVSFVGSFRSLGSVSVSCSSSATQNNLAAGELRTSGYAVVDVGVVSIPVEMREASVTVRAGVQNLFNKAYQNHLATLRGAVLCEPGRNFYLSAGFAI